MKARQRWRFRHGRRESPGERRKPRRGLEGTALTPCEREKTINVTLYKY